MHLGILQCGTPPPAIAARFGTYPEMFAALFGGRGWRFSSFDAEGMVFPGSPHDADAWLLTGSRHGVYDPLPFIAPLEDFVRATHAAQVPLLGICFGHQIVAQALGGRVEKSASGWGLGRHVYAAGPLGDLALCAWHQDQVIAPPDDAETIANSAFCPHAGLAYAGGRILTLQPHPEFTAPVAAAFIALRREDPIYPPERMADAEDSLAAGFDTEPAVAFMAGFLQRAVDAARHDRASVAHG